MLKQKEPQPQIFLPPAKLYLDDIEQIIRILTEALGTEQDSSGGVESVELLFQIRDHTTNDIHDLSKIHPDRTNDFYVGVRLARGVNANVTIMKSQTILYSFGLTTNEDWGLFHRLEALFETRKRRWKKLLHAHSKVSNWIYGATSALLFVALGPLVALRFVPRIPTWFPWTPLVLFIVILAALVISLRIGLSSHSIVIFHNRTDHASRGQEQIVKTLLDISKLVISFLLGVLTLYLKHKYWP
jgi:hypothetical protein